MWLQSQGISAFVLEYRVAGIGAFAYRHRAIFRGRQHPDMITDAQRALQWVRTHADEYHINPDNALERTNLKFIRRFNYVEAKAKEAGKRLNEMTLEEMDALWNEAKESC